MVKMDKKMLEKITQGVVIALVISDIFLISIVNRLGAKPKAKGKTVPSFGRQEAELLVESTARISRDHNDANVLCLSGDQIGEVLLRKIVEVWLDTEFSCGRHKRRLNNISAIEQGQDPTTISTKNNK